jgi:hypothetical protein
VDVEAVFDGLRANAATLEGLRCYEYVPDSVAPPAFFPVDVVIDYVAALVTGMPQMTVRCQILTSRASDRSGQKLLKEYLAESGALSLPTALRSDPTLGGACHDLQLQRINGYRIYEHQAQKFYGAGLELLVIGS